MAGEGPGAAAIETGFRPATTETPKTTETPITPLTPATGENATGENPASNLENSARQEGDHKALEKFATASSDADVFKDYQKKMRSEQEDNNINIPIVNQDKTDVKTPKSDATASSDPGVFKDYQKTMRTEQADDIDAPTEKPTITVTKTTESQATASQDPKVAAAYREQMGTVHIDDDIPTTEPVKTDITKDHPQASTPTSPPETSHAYQSQKDTNPDRERDKIEPPVEENVDAATAAPQTENKIPDEAKQTEEDHMTKTPGEIVSEIQAQKDEKTENSDEKNENTESEKQKRIDEMINIADITSQMKDINPKFNPKDPDSRKFLENLAEKTNKMELASQTLNMLNKNKKTLENLGIDPKEVNRKTVEAMAEQVKKKTQEQANDPDPKKQEENKENSENVSFLELLMTLLAAGAMGMIEEVGKEASRE